MSAKDQVLVFVDLLRLYKIAVSTKEKFAADCVLTRQSEVRKLSPASIARYWY